MKVVLLNPPRYYWPYLSEYDNYMLPQAMPCLAAVLREHDVDVRAIDCLPLRLGWKSLRARIAHEQPDMVGVCTSETMFIPEAIKACKMVKEIDPSIATVVGGAHFSNLVGESLQQRAIDFIVIGEGEYTLLELVQGLAKPKVNFSKIRGIAFRRGKEIVQTPPRPLVQNLDDLPMPAYDLMPMDRYGGSRFLYSPGGTTIHHSRGCVHNCKFCVWWVQMSERRLINGRVVCFPKWRTKSVERTVAEMELLRTKYKKRYLEFVDDTWNVNPEWNAQFADALIERNLDIGWFAFMRADYILRDEQAGIFRKLVDAGLVRICIGAERAVNSDLKLLGKGGYSHDTVKKCFKILHDRYPHIFRQATFIVGLRNETRESMLQLFDYARQLKADFPSFHPITPIPGTALWEEAKSKGWIEVTDFAQYDWLTPIISSEHLTRDEIVDLIFLLNRKLVRLGWLLKGLLSRGEYKRRMYAWWLIITAKILLDSALARVTPQGYRSGSHAYITLIKPRWYDK